MKYRVLILVTVLLALIFLIWPSLLKNIWGLVLAPLIVSVLSLVIEYRILKPMERKRGIPDNPDSAQVKISKDGASSHASGTNATASGFSFTSGGGSVTVTPTENSLEITDAEGNKKVYRNSIGGYHYEIPKQSGHSAEAHVGYSFTDTLATLDENQVVSLSQKIAEQHLQVGERLIRAFLGQMNVDFGDKNLEELLGVSIHQSEVWCCVVLTHANLLLIKLNYLGREINTDRFLFSQFEDSTYYRNMNTDTFRLRFRTGNTIEIRVLPVFQKQVQSTVSILNARR